ncbi:hypothetical protein C8R44DRAFT_760565 [Mycena epipterygia]|nr:hypothetical protein C8R44DRAFT_760565 [Mycena epipterygia]
MTTVISPSNVLPHSQRLRLARSIRKLGDLLTESALLVDSAPPPLPTHSLSHSHSHTISTSTSTPAQHLTAPNTHPRGNKFFSLRTRTPLASPLSPTFSASFSVSMNTSATDTKVAQAQSQPVDENAPLELVFPPMSPRQVRGRKRASTVSIPEPHSMPAAAAAAGRRQAHARAASRTLKHAASSTSLCAQETEIEPFSYPSLVPVPALPAPHARRTKEGGMHRKEAGWSGEWSGTVQSMDDVVRGLRGLRVK